MSPVHVGIDPGVGGAIVVIEGGRVVEQYSTPKMKVEREGKGPKEVVNEAMLYDLLLLHAQDGINSITIERQFLKTVRVKDKKTGRWVTVPQKGAFTIADHHGWLRGIATSFNCKVFNPRPQDWQTIIEDAELASVYLFAPSSDDPKARSIAAAKVLLPDLDLIPGTKRTEQHGIADAGLIALWGERMYHDTDD